MAPPVPQTSSSTRARVGALGAAIVILGCVGHSFLQSEELERLQSEIDASQEPAKERNRLETERRPIQEEIETLKKELEAIDRKKSGVKQLASQADRFSRLLKMIAENSNSHLVLQEIKMNEAVGLRLSGRAMRLEAASEMANRLSEPAAQVGWTVHAPSLTGDNLLANGGPWHFTIDLEDSHLEEAEATEETATPTDSATDEPIAGAQPEPVTLTQRTATGD